MPKLIFMHGPAASGKLTIAKELSELTSFKLFHNHLTVDMLLSLFPFGSPNFIKHRHRIWHDLIVDAISEGSDLIFTFCPENTVDPSFATELVDSVTSNGGTVSFVQITCPDDVLVTRMGSESRKKHLKLWAGEDYLRFKAEGSFDTEPLPTPTVIIDSSLMQPKEAAKSVVFALGLSSSA